MAPPAAVDWTDRARLTLGRYSEPLRREVADRLVRPRAGIPAGELADKCLGTLANPPVVDRRIKELPDPARKLLACIGLSRRPTWRAGHLVTLAAALGHADGLAPVFHLLEAGLLFPDLPDHAPAEVVRFDTWLGWAGTLHAPLIALPAVAARARGEELGLPDLSEKDEKTAGLNPAAREADGLDWLLRLAATWQQVAATPVRLTQANTLFKRDLVRFQTDPVLSAAAPDELLPVPDAGVLALFWAAAAGLLRDEAGELLAGPFPERWGPQLGPALADLWAGLTAVESWDPVRGYAPAEDGPSPFPTATLLILLLLARGKPGVPFDPQAVADWLWEHHPSWGGTLGRELAADRGRAWVEALLVGVAYPLRLVSVSVGVKEDGEDEEVGSAPHTHTHTFHTCLSDHGRHLLAGGPEPVAGPSFPQALMVQPNAEILAYRQGLSPALVAKLSRVAVWKGLGPACTLELTADQTYRGLESGLTLAGMLQVLNQHAARPVPAPVQDLLRRWADKRERITLFAAATLVEFQTPDDLDAAVARGLVAVKLSDRIGMTDDGRDPDFKSLRLVGNRDYESKPQQCVTVGDDGLTLGVDPAQADLLLDAEITRLADPVVGDPPGVRRYRITPDTLRRAGAAGMGPAELDGWFGSRAGQPLSPAARLFTLAPGLAPPAVERLLVVKVPTADVADGLAQWPETRGLIAERLGPTALAVAEADVPRLREALAGIGVALG